jgi:hypothetical protein
MVAGSEVESETMVGSEVRMKSEVRMNAKCLNPPAAR